MSYDNKHGERLNSIPLINPETCFWRLIKKIVSAIEIGLSTKPVL
jgi:hypothetical protein